ncbi:glycosyltransferase family A protein [Treponema brennaborense]|uniref:Glycosyltransferase 2-like domain-containing protein n=1 Tax=Treponema brennaborense (strain DSM 12168 / CIP 105900 / DD5/3) TaxID=906968 RepID=F4LMH6_TREBD|nr:glycosyltransferase family A protein [Treponema brennaborense]AEE15738.1 hypothetical protein Trebr_0290 [Treponema brennaborense DSM 12168]
MRIISRVFRRLAMECKLYAPVFSRRSIDNLTVSLTSYPARLPLLHQVIRSLLHQTVKPARIVLYLGTDTEERDIPTSLRKLQNHDFIIKTGYDDIKPHKKYYYAMQEYPEDIIITVDDDLLYDRNLIRDLYDSYIRHPNCVSARRVHKMSKKENGKDVDLYNNWEWECKDTLQPSFSLVATGVGGVLYPPKILPAAAFNIENIKKYCLNTDDIWLKFMELENDVKVVFTNSKIIHPLTVRNTQKHALMAANVVTENGNDSAIKALQQCTGINLADYII